MVLARKATNSNADALEWAERHLRRYVPDVADDAPEGGINAIATVGAIRFRDVQEDTFD
jgi:hypothetical protein